MKDLTVRQLEEYLLDHYQQSRTEEGLFIKLVEEVGEVAEVLNGRSGRKEGVQDSNEELAKELADIIHYTVAIVAINDIDLTKTIFEKDKKNMTCYSTPFGNLMVGISATNIDVNTTEENIDIEVRYILDLNYEHMADCTINLNIKSKNNQEFHLS